MRVISNSDQNTSTTKPLEVSSSIQTNQKPKKGPIQIDISTLKGGEFANSLKANLRLNNENKIHEEQLQAGIVEAILQQADKNTGVYFKSTLNSLVGKGTPLEDSVKLALSTLVKEGYMTKSDANLVNGVSFRAAQLDSNLEALYDDKGGPSDITIAVDTLEKSIFKASEVIAKIQGGALVASSRELSTPSNSITPSSHSQNPISSSPTSTGSTGAVSGSGGFLWKPISDSNGKLVVLMPPSLSGKVSTVSIYADDPANGGTPIESGRFTGIANGNRGHYRFSKPGSSYPDGAYVIATLDNGSNVKFQIGDSSLRNTK